MKNVRKLLGVMLFSGCLATGQTAYAASATVTVDFDLPTIIVMYHYSTVDVTVSQAVLGGFLSGGALCGVDRCEDLGTSAMLTLAALSGSVDAGVDDTYALANTTATVTVQNAVGVRALGCTTYTGSYIGGVSDPGVTITAGPLVGINTLPCSMTMTTGDLAFDVDFTAVTTDPVSAVFDVTIAGV